MLSPYALFRPFLWVAVAAFITGFSAFLLLGGGASASVGHRLIDQPVKSVVFEVPAPDASLRKA